ncbi:MAG TPA: hypothetical protein VKU00_13260 [Chthonomonadaceae bacterium]|nr:hypothetical protein [Chthonomonadaceae bacterium]
MSFSHKRLQRLTAMATFGLICLGGFACQSQAQTYDPVADYPTGFANGLNPNGVWTYGWSNGLSGAFTIYPDHRVIQPDCDPIDAWDDLSNNVEFTPVVYQSTAACSNGNVDYPAGALILHGGGQNDTAYSHILFTAPASGAYAISIAFTGRQVNVNADAHVLHNGLSLFDTVISSDGQSESFSDDVSLAAGDVIDFAVGQNNGSQVHPGTVQLTGTLSIVPAPVLASLSPTSADAGSSALTLTLKGSDFASGDVVQWIASHHTTPLATTFISSSKLQATVPASLIASPGKASVNVIQTGGATSSSKTFTILLTSLALTAANMSKDGSGNYIAALTLKNTGFFAAQNITITASTLGTAATSTSLPASVGNIAAGSTGNATLTYPSSAGTSGKRVSLKVSGTFTGGRFSLRTTVTLP